MQIAQSKVLSLSTFLQSQKGSWVFIPTCLSLFRRMFVYLSLYVTPSTPLLSLLPIWVFHFFLTSDTSLSGVTQGFHLGRVLSFMRILQLADKRPCQTTCTCIDMKSVLTSTTEFCGAVETAYQWQCRSCDQIKEAAKFGDSYVDVLKVSLQQPQGSKYEKFALLCCYPWRD